MERLLDGAVGMPNMNQLLQTLPNDKLVLGSEACHCPTTGYAGDNLKVTWARAQQYAHTVLADLASGSNGWIEWNVLLDNIGGPNHLKNLCDAPLLAVPHRAKHPYYANDTTTTATTTRAGWTERKSPFGDVIGDTRTREELDAMGVPANYLDLGVVVQPMYYYMGHISRHVSDSTVFVTKIHYSYHLS